MEAKKGTAGLNDWKGKIQERLYVVMSRGYLHVRWQSFPTANENVDLTGRLIFSHGKQQLIYLKGMSALVTVTRF